MTLQLRYEEWISKVRRKADYIPGRRQVCKGNDMGGKLAQRCSENNNNNIIIRGQWLKGRVVWDEIRNISEWQTHKALLTVLKMLPLRH